MRAPFSILRCAVAGVLLATVACALPHARAADGLRPVASPTVAGPVTGGKGHPFMGLLEVPRGYVQEEFFFSGRATADGCSPAHTLVPAVGVPQPPTRCPKISPHLPDAPYTSRMNVVRPADPKRFNGTVVVVWQNVSFVHDVGAWFTVGEQIVRGGYAYVEVDAQLLGIPSMKAFDPGRYARVVHPGDAYAYDIYSQAAKTLRSGSDVKGIDAMHGLKVSRMLAYGASQSGYTLNEYLDFVYPNVEHVYDGFLVTVANGNDPRRRVPVLRLLSENELRGVSLSPDSANYRQWEIAGSAHGNKAAFDYIGAQEKRDMRVRVLAGLAGDNGPYGLKKCLVNRFPMEHAYAAALDSLDRWVRGGAPPAHGPRVAIKDGSIVRDKDGNGVGGIRLPGIDAPIATYNEGGDCVSLDGRTVYFTPAKLKARYATHSGYVSRVQTAAKRAVAARFLLPADATATIAAAAASKVPTSAT